MKVVHTPALATLCISGCGFVRFEQLLEQILSREIDLVPYGGLGPGVDEDILREAVPL